MLENAYPGLKDLDLEQVEVYLAMVSFSGGELAVVQAKDADGAAKVKEIFQARVTAKTTDGPGNEMLLKQKYEMGVFRKRFPKSSAILDPWLKRL